MKSFGKSGFHINPINRDLIVVISAGMLIALAIVTLFMMIVSQF
jgi:hypothetical protein